MESNLTQQLWVKSRFDRATEKFQTESAITVFIAFTGLLLTAITLGLTIKYEYYWIIGFQILSALISYIVFKKILKNKKLTAETTKIVFEDMILLIYFIAVSAPLLLIILTGISLFLDPISHLMLAEYKQLKIKYQAAKKEYDEYCSFNDIVAKEFKDEH